VNIFVKGIFFIRSVRPLGVRKLPFLGPGVRSAFPSALILRKTQIDAAISYGFVVVLTQVHIDRAFNFMSLIMYDI